MTVQMGVYIWVEQFMKRKELTYGGTESITLIAPTLQAIFAQIVVVE